MLRSLVLPGLTKMEHFSSVLLLIQSTGTTLSPGDADVRTYMCTYVHRKTVVWPLVVYWKG